MADHALRVLFLPQWYGNPYQRLLDESLTRQGVLVERLERGFWPLVRRLLRRQPDVIHLHWLQPFYEAPSRAAALAKLLLFFTGILWLRMRGSRIVWTVHNLRDHEQRFPRLDRWCTSFVVRRSRSIIVHCPRAREALTDGFPVPAATAVSVIPHGHYLDTYPNTITREPARRSLGVNEKSLMILFFGNVRPYKGILELLDAFARLDESNVSLWIVGRPLVAAEAELIRERAGRNPRVTFRPEFVPDDQVQRYMNASDAVVLPYRDILTSGAAVLAMSFARPIIAPRIGCLPDILDPRGSFLYEPDDDQGLARALHQAISRRDELPEMGKHNQRVAAEWSWDRIAAMTLAAYRGSTRVN